MVKCPTWDALGAFRSPAASGRVAFLGDSTLQGTVGLSPTGGAPESLRVLMAPRFGRGGEGALPVFREKWAFAGTWTSSSSGAADDAGAFPDNVKTATGSSAIATCTTAGDGFYVDVLDVATSEVPSWVVDNGSIWADVPGLTLTGSGLVKRSSLISTPFTTNVKIRAASSAGASRTVKLMEIEPILNAGGVIVDNIAHNSFNLFQAARNVAIPAGGSAGAALSKQLTVLNPDVLIVEFTNDANPLVWGDGSVFSENLGVMKSVCTALGIDLLLFVYFPRNDYDASSPQTQAQQRARIRAFAIANNLPFFDLQDDWPTAASAVSAGLIQSGGDLGHPTQAGCDRIAQRIWSLLAKTGNEGFVRA